MAQKGYPSTALQLALTSEFVVTCLLSSKLELGAKSKSFDHPNMVKSNLLGVTSILRPGMGLLIRAVLGGGFCGA